MVAAPVVAVSPTFSIHQEHTRGWLRLPLSTPPHRTHPHSRAYRRTGARIMLTVHHLGVSQCERVLWLLEELGLHYELVKHTRDPLLSPKTLKDVPGNTLGKSPFVVDSESGLTMNESGAIVEYIIHKYGNGRFAV